MLYNGKKILTIDTETTGLSPYKGDRPFLFTAYDGKTKILDEKKPSKTLLKMIESDSYTKVFANAKFDLHMLRSVGIEVSGRVFDVLQMRHLYDETFKIKYRLAKAGLKETAQILCKIEPLDEQKVKKWFMQNKKMLIERYRPEWQARFEALPISNIMDYDTYEAEYIIPQKSDDKPARWKRFDALPKEFVHPYALNDVVITYKVFETLLPHVDTDEELRSVWYNESDMIKVLLDMETRGVPIDIKGTIRLYEDLNERSMLFLNKVSKKYGKDFNIDSTKQLGDMLKKDKVKGLQYTPTMQIKTSEDALETYDHPLTKSLLEYRKMQKIINTYCIGLLEACDQNGVIHTTYRSTGTVTGRMSSSDPNLQNIPRPEEQDELSQTIRKLFLVRKGYTNYYLDYKQIEYRLAADLFEDVDLIQRINNGEDVHMIQAQRIFQKQDVTKEERSKGKMINFAILYGAGIEKIARSLKTDVDSAKRLLNIFYRANPRIRKIKNEIYETLKKRGYLKNAFGRRYHMPVEDGYKGLNYWCQGTAGDIVKFSQVDIHNYLKKKNAKTQMLLNVHDELQIEVPAGEKHHIKQIQKFMEDFPEFAVKIQVDVESSKTCWADKK